MTGYIVYFRANINKVSVAVLLMCCAMSSHAFSDRNGQIEIEDPNKKQENLIQGMIGVMKFEHDTFSLTDVNGETYKGDMPSLPYLGGLVQFKHFQSKRMSAGLEAGVLFGFVNYSTTVVVNGGASVYFKNQFLLADGMFGGYVDLLLADRFRFYVGAGPMAMYGRLRLDNQDDVSIQPVYYVNQTVTAFGLGGYARTGLEFKVGSGTFFGVQARYITADLDFGNDVGEVDMSGYQYMLTATQAY